MPRLFAAILVDEMGSSKDLLPFRFAFRRGATDHPFAPNFDDQRVVVCQEVVFSKAVYLETNDGRSGLFQLVL